MNTIRPQYITISLTIVFLILLGLLHLLKPELNPNWRMISEYELGNYGWLMQVAFFSLATASLFLTIAVRPHIHTLAGRIGMGWLVIGAIGMFLGCFFVTDPIITPKIEWSLSGKLHNLGGSIFILGLPFFTSLISWALLKSDTLRKPAGSLILLLLAIIWLSIIAFFSLVATSPQPGQLGPTVFVGWPNRIFMVAYCAWLLIIDWRLVAKPLTKK